MTDFISRAAVLEILRTPAASDTFPDMIRRVEALEPVAQPETPIPGQFETMCLAIEDVVTGRGFDVDPWHPIETAPKDGLIDIWLGEGRRWCDCYYDRICDEWRTSRPSGRLVSIKSKHVTHWMPRPEPPGETTSAIPEAVKAYLRNALMVGGWRGERE